MEEFTKIFLEKAQNRYFINIQISSRDEKYNIYWLHFKWEGEEEVSPFNFNDKVEVGETLDEAVRRCLKNDLGIEKIISIYPTVKISDAPDKEGNMLPRYGISVEVPYEPIQPIQKGLSVQWEKHERPTYKEEKTNDNNGGKPLGETFLKKDTLRENFSFVWEPALADYKVQALIWDGKEKYLDFTQLMKSFIKDYDNLPQKPNLPIVPFTVRRGEKLPEVLWNLLRKYLYFDGYTLEITDFVGGVTIDGQTSSLYTIIVTGDFELNSWENFQAEWKKLPIEITPDEPTSEFEFLTERAGHRLLRHFGLLANVTVRKREVKNSKHDPVEGIKFLENNKNLSPLAGNKFQNKENALAFVKKLYELGATKVLVDGILAEPERIRKEGGPYADTLLVTLPTELDKRAQLFRFIEENQDPDYAEKIEDTGQTTETLWWD